MIKHAKTLLDPRTATLMDIITHAFAQRNSNDFGFQFHRNEKRFSEWPNKGGFGWSAVEANGYDFDEDCPASYFYTGSFHFWYERDGFFIIDKGNRKMWFSTSEENWAEKFEEWVRLYFHGLTKVEDVGDWQKYRTWEDGTEFIYHLTWKRHKHTDTEKQWQGFTDFYNVYHHHLHGCVDARLKAYKADDSKALVLEIRWPVGIASGNPNEWGEPYYATEEGLFLIEWMKKHYRMSICSVDGD